MISLTYCKDTSISKHQYYYNSFVPFAFQSILVLGIAFLCLDNCFNPSRHALYQLLTLLNWYPLPINLNSLPQFINPLRRGVVMLGLGYRASVASEVKSSRYEEGLHLIGSRGSYTRDFLGIGQGFQR